MDTNKTYDPKLEKKDGDSLVRFPDVKTMIDPALMESEN